MFKTLRGKLIFSYGAVAALCLLLTLGVAFTLARSYNERLSYQSLREKSALAIPFVTMELADQRRPVPPNLLKTFEDSVRISGLRVLFVDPETMAILEDTSPPLRPSDNQFDLGDVGATDPRLYQPRVGITGKFRMRGELVSYLYFARAVRVGQPLKSALGGQANNTPGGRSIIVVFAQRERNLGELAGQLLDFLWPPALVALLLSLAVGYGLARSVSRPVARLAEGATAMSRGDYSQRIQVEGQDELAALTRRFNQMAEEVGRAHQMERDFVANVSHDLKTPLTSIQGFSQAMLDGAIADERGYEEAATIINSEAQRMNRLVGELLNLTRLQNGLDTIELSPTDLGELLAQLALAMQPQAATAGVSLTLQTGGTGVLVLADGDRLKQAFGNLLDNAIKHTPSGGAVVVELRPSTPQADIIVRDSGEGIPNEDLNRVMERFYQVDKSRSAMDGKSAGLGLAIAREVVRAHHGEMRIESEPGRGTAIHVLLPSAPMPAASEPGRRGRLKLLNPATRRTNETDASA
jgi:signal transduction histidine kinase